MIQTLRDFLSYCADTYESVTAYTNVCQVNPTQ